MAQGAEFIQRELPPPRRRGRDGLRRRADAWPTVPSASARFPPPESPMTCTCQDNARRTGRPGRGSCLGVCFSVCLSVRVCLMAAASKQLTLSFSITHRSNCSNPSSRLPTSQDSPQISLLHLALLPLTSSSSASPPSLLAYAPFHPTKPFSASHALRALSWLQPWLPGRVTPSPPTSLTTWQHHTVISLLAQPASYMHVLSRGH